jgi:ABC-type glutathione transport system ATPase component
LPLVSAVGLAKSYRAGDVDVPAVRDVNFTIEPGAFVAFVGPSGSGKSTHFNMIGYLDHPTNGRLSVLDTDVARLDRRVPGDRVRADRCGLQRTRGPSLPAAWRVPARNLNREIWRHRPERQYILHTQ